jgi:dolichol kinase
MNIDNTLYKLTQQRKTLSADIRTELLRKSIHMLIVFVPFLVGLIGRGPTLALLAGGVVFYTYAEIQRTKGNSVPFITGLTNAAARPADFRSRIILGPITLGIGTMAALILYPRTASIIAIYALAFGDSFSSIIGRSVGRISLGGLREKTLEGSLACFLIVFFIALRMFNSPAGAGLIALTATVLEAIPVKDLDNIAMPMGSGLVACLVLSW